MRPHNGYSMSGAAIWRREKLRGGMETPMMEAHLAKFRSLMPSLALLFHLVDVAAGGGTAP